MRISDWCSDVCSSDLLADLLYQGRWVAERYAAVRGLYERAPEEIDPVVRGIVEQAARYSAVDAFEAEYRRAELARLIKQRLAEFDAMVVPTAQSIYHIAQLRADTRALNQTDSKDVVEGKRG